VTDCKIKSELTREQAEFELEAKLSTLYPTIGINMPIEVRLDDAHDIMLRIAEDYDICFKGEY